MQSQMPSIEQIERIVNLLDQGVHLPGVPMRLPLDPIVGLVPLAGDVLTLTISGCIIAHAQKLGIPRSVQRKMVFNALTDCILGSVPLFGDIFDFIYKANRKNLALLKQHMTAQSQRANPAQQSEAG